MDTGPQHRNVGGVQHRVLVAFLSWLEKRHYRIIEIGTRPVRTLSSKEVLDEYQLSSLNTMEEAWKK